MYFEKLVKGGEKKGGEGLGDGEKQGWGYLSFPPPPHRAIPLPPPFCPASFPSPLLLEGGGALEPGGDLQQAGLELDLEKDLHGPVRGTKGQLKSGSGLWARPGPREGQWRGSGSLLPPRGQVFLGLTADE